MTTDTTTPSCWLNWRFLVCAILIFAAMLVSVLLVWKYEGSTKSRSQRRENGQKKAGFLYKDDVWKTCYNAIHPNWLLAYRLIAFSLLLSLLIADVILHGIRILYFYTQWTFILVTVYFGLGSSLSIHGCLQFRKGGGSVSTDGVDTERGTYSAPVPENASVLIVSNGLNSHGEPHVREAADPWGLAFQIIFQMTAGAVVLTDCVFWLVIYPFLTDKNYKLHFLAVCVHSVNAICLLAVPFLPDSIFCSLDMRVCYFPVDPPYFCLVEVAVSLSRFVFSICSPLVCCNLITRCVIIFSRGRRVEGTLLSVFSISLAMGSLPY